MEGFQVIWDNIAHFMIGRYPSGPLGGLALTFMLALVSCILSFFGGLIMGLLCISNNRFIRYPTLAVVNAIRGIPLLMVIFWMYFLLPCDNEKAHAGELDGHCRPDNFYIGLHVPDSPGGN